MTLTSIQIEMIAVDTLLKRELRVKGSEAEEFQKKLEKDISLAKRKNWSLELPFDLRTNND